MEEIDIEICQNTLKNIIKKIIFHFDFLYNIK